MEDVKKILPEIVENDSLDELQVEKNSFALPETSFENATLEDIEKYYRVVLRKGAVYFVGFESGRSDDKSVSEKEIQPERRSFFVTGDVADQLTTVALKFGGVVYQLNDDFYIVRNGSESLMEHYKTSSVFVSSLSSEELEKLMTLFNVTGQTLGLQTVARGSLLDLVEFQKAFKTLNQNKSVYLIDLAFIDFTIQEASSFQAYLQTNAVDLLTVNDFADIFSVYLSCSVDNLRSRNFYSQSLLGSDGNKSQFDVGTEHSREQRSISDQGTSTVSGYDKIEDGIQLTFTPENCLGDVVLCSVTLENSAFTDESYNTKSETTLDVSKVPFKLGRTYYLSSLSNISKVRGISLFGVDFTRNNRIQTCWVRVRKIK